MNTELQKAYIAAGSAILVAIISAAISIRNTIYTNKATKKSKETETILSNIREQYKGPIANLHKATHHDKKSPEELFQEIDSIISQDYGLVPPAIRETFHQLKHQENSVAITELTNLIDRTYNKAALLLGYTKLDVLSRKSDNLKDFMKKVVAHLNKIPEENLTSPPIHIVGSILENVEKYYHDEEYLREMFAKLIASSMNQQNKTIHPSFVEVIKQLSSDDATMLTNIIYHEDDSVPLNMRDAVALCYTYTIEQDTLDALISHSSFDIEEVMYISAICYSGKFITTKNDFIKVTRNESEDMLKSLSHLKKIGLINLDFFDSEPIEFILEDDVLNPEDRAINPKDRSWPLRMYLSMTRYGISFTESCICVEIRNK